MATDPDVKTFLENSNLYMHVETMEAGWEAEFARAIHGFRRESEKEEFRRGFAKAILGGVTPNEYERATGWDFATTGEFQAHLEHYWNLFYPDSKPEDWASAESPFSTLEGYRGWKNEEGGAVFYTVEREDGVPVIRVEELKLVGRVLHVVYILTSPSLYDGLARSLIRLKIVRDVCLGAYDSQADTIEYTSNTTKRVVTVPYAAG